DPAAARADPRARAPAAEVGPAAPAVRRTAPAAEAVWVCRTDNFAVSAPSKGIAEKISHAAEKARKALALRWLGKELPVWAEPCPLRVKVTAQRASGVTAFQFTDERFKILSMELEGRRDGIVKDSLPHEVTHAVLAHWY